MTFNFGRCVEDAPVNCGGFKVVPLGVEGTMTKGTPGEFPGTGFPPLFMTPAGVPLPSGGDIFVVAIVDTI